MERKDREDLGLSNSAREMWTRPALYHKLRQQDFTHRRRGFVFIPAPLPRNPRELLIRNVLRDAEKDIKTGEVIPAEQAINQIESEDPDN